MISIKHIELTTDDILAFEEVYNRIILEYTEKLSIDDFLHQAFVWSTELPFQLKAAIYDFKLGEKDNCLVLKNIPVGSQDSIETPIGYQERDKRVFLSKDEVFLTLVSSLLGEVFTWNSIQNGNIINDIIPLKENEIKVHSSGYKKPFDLHTEDAFHPNSGEYLALLCLRNPTQTATTLSSLNIHELDADTVETLFKPSYIIGENVAHTVREVIHRSSILFGDQSSPYIRINLNKIACADANSQLALDALKSNLVLNTTKVILNRGDLILIDNLRTVHGREDINHSLMDLTDGSNGFILLTALNPLAIYAPRPMEEY